ncbi:MAG: CRISPR-associated endonuclease Cas2 [Anaerolineae bacterium]|nr:CRISPR-associated endonuclease Cas2 [Anaerolineae bacterium]
MNRVFWVVCYDIADDRRRSKTMKMLEGFGRHVQESVFECELDKTRLLRLQELLTRLINAQEDNVRLYPLNEADLKKVQILGNATLQRSERSVIL